MLDEIKMIKAKFEMIRIIVGDTLTLEDLSNPKYLKSLIDATENTYVHLNDSICEDLHMCRECAQKRELLSSYLHLFDDLELGKTVHDAHDQIHAFPEAIKQVIDRINTVLVDLKK
ncbi:hypothetical protein YH65_03950 [Sulfurovum lithotrophicum]|uniref:Chemoreceptor zinc-binding domain-containing protein n=1 Tax=Sulfurovum lithotrophicum TaxID=206403 RepID=A0A7U4M0K5_9BACT|nr:hypothetical protein [Sulfurovum lithotrophicum]AKF24633.1 hypothetical protein YH65_03950 [Sulfurovum lithotrophicum]